MKKMLITSSIQLDALAIVTSILLVIFAWHKWVLGYWKRKGVAGPEPTLICGNLKEFFLGKKPLGLIFQDIYNEYKTNGSRYVGCYFAGQPTYLPIDLKLVRSVFQSDFPHFHSHGSYHNESVDPLSANVFNLDGSRWKEVRAKLTPTFTSGKIKLMHSILNECTKVLEEILNAHPSNNPIDIKDVMARFTTDVIGSCAFGVEINSLRNPNAEFRKHGILLFDTSVGNMLRFAAPLFIPHGLLRLFKFGTQQSDVTNFFTNSVQSTIKYREENNVKRPDFMDMMIQMKNTNDENEKLTLSEIIGQSFIFFGAGFETSSTTIHYASYELAIDRDIQDKAREEINEVLSKHNNKLTYDAVMEMEYLEMIVKETLRKYPPLAFLFRKCTKKYTIPGENVEIDEGTTVILSSLGIHYDPEYYPNPQKFDPERFTKENVQSRPGYTWIPFGEGPRICIGLRFGIYQVKMGLITLLKNYRVSLNKKTINPLVFSTSGFIHTCIGGIWLDLEKISS